MTLWTQELVPSQGERERAAWVERDKERRAAIRLAVSELAQLALVGHRFCKPSHQAAPRPPADG